MAAKRNVFLNFTDRELRVIECRIHGIRPKAIGALTGVSPHAIRQVTYRIYCKTGLHNLAQLTKWAIENCVDIATPDTAENAFVPEPKVHKGKIRLGRIRRAYARQCL